MSIQGVHLTHLRAPAAQRQSTALAPTINCGPSVGDGFTAADRGTASHPKLGWFRLIADIVTPPQVRVLHQEMTGQPGGRRAAKEAPPPPHGRA